MCGVTSPDEVVQGDAIGRHSDASTAPRRDSLLAPADAQDASGSDVSEPYDEDDDVNYAGDDLEVKFSQVFGGLLDRKMFIYEMAINQTVESHF